MNIAAIPATDLIGEGSRVNYSLLVAGEELLVEEYKKNITNLLTESARISDRSDSNERTNQAINRSQQFLSMTTIISILLSAIAIAMSARRFMKRRMDTVALMKSLGAKKTICCECDDATIIDDRFGRCHIGLPPRIYCRK